MKLIKEAQDLCCSKFQPQQIEYRKFEVIFDDLESLMIQVTSTL